jgi:hypothetical protein
MRRRPIGLLAAVPLAVIALAGCAGHKSGPGVASAGGAGTQTASARPSTSANRQAQLLQYAQCMREHGVDMPDPVDNSGQVVITMPSGAAQNDSRVKAAMQACQQFLPNGGAPPTLSPAQLDQLRQYVQCMRDHGIQMADPDPNTGGIQIGNGSTGSGGKTAILNDPKYKEAQDACQSKLPQGGGK